MSVTKLFDLSGKTALVTGGSRGIGLQMAEGLGEMGARVAVTARKQDELDKASAHLGALGIECLTIAGDLATFTSIPGVVDTVMSRWGQIDILVNNAGCNWAAPAEDYPDDGWRKVMSLNEKWAAARCSRAEAARSSTLRRSRDSLATRRIGGCGRWPTTRAKAPSLT